MSKPKQARKTSSFRLAPGIAKELRDRARAEDRTLTTVVTRALKMYFEQASEAANGRIIFPSHSPSPPSDSDSDSDSGSSESGSSESGSGSDAPARAREETPPLKGLVSRWRECEDCDGIGHVPAAHQQREVKPNRRDPKCSEPESGKANRIRVETQQAGQLMQTEAKAAECAECNGVGTISDGLQSSPRTCPACERRGEKAKPTPKRRRGRKIHPVTIPRALVDIGINRRSFRLRVETCCKAKNQKAWQTELDLLSTYVAEYGAEAVLETWTAAVGSGWQGCAPFVRETAMRLRKLDGQDPQGRFHELAAAQHEAEPEWPPHIVEIEAQITALYELPDSPEREKHLNELGMKAYDLREEFKSTAK